MTLDLRYIGTLSRKLYGNMDLNAPNFLYNGLKDAFDAARRGGESTLLDNMFRGMNISGGGVVDGTTVTGAAALRASHPTSGALANGNYQALASTLNTLTINCLFAGNGALPACTQTDPQGRTLASLSGSVLRQNSPENFIKTNPQTNTAVYETNLGHANYHSLQTQLSVRPIAGISTQVTYTWSRNLGQVPGEGPNGTGALFTDPTDRAADYALLANHRQHTLVNYGTFELPLGPNKLLFSNSSGFWARLAENWQSSWVLNLSSGAPVNVFAQPMLYGSLGNFTGVPDIVGTVQPQGLQVQVGRRRRPRQSFRRRQWQPLVLKDSESYDVSGRCRQQGPAVSQYECCRGKSCALSALLSRSRILKDASCCSIRYLESEETLGRVHLRAWASGPSTWPFKRRFKSRSPRA